MVVKRTLAICLIIFASSRIFAAATGDTVQEFVWTQLKKDGKLSTGEVEGDTLKFKASAQPSQTIMVIDQPKISAAVYMIRGKVKYENVGGKGYFELWSHFGDGSAYFSRTLSDTGATQALSGSSDWRDFELAFDSTGAKAPLQKLVFNLVLPGGKGTVWLKNDVFGWWRDEVGGIIGGALGMIIGFGGALIGFLAMKGKARGLALALIKTIIFVGVAALMTGIIAVIVKQPYGVYYPLLLVGVLGIAIPLGLLPLIHKRYADAELRKMQAMDA
jgi:hypothetical protein